MDYAFTFEDGSEVLAHYGVLGMRWGVRHDKGFKSAKKSITSNKSMSKEQKKSAINEEKVKAANRLYSTNSSATNRKIQTRSTAATLGMTALYSSYGAMHYDRARTGEGYSRGKAAIRGILSGYVNQASKNVIPVMGVAGAHNYIKDRRGRNTGQVSGGTNRRYLEGKLSLG